MGFLSTTLAVIITIIVVAFTALYFYLKIQYKYWSKRNVPHTNPRFLFGDLTFGDVSLTEVLIDLYNKFEKERFFGIWMLHRPCLMVNDPELIKNILVQDFVHFHDHGSYHNEKDDPLSAHLLSINGAKWKNLRTKISPSFSSGKMKSMFPIVADIGKKLGDILDYEGSEGKVHEMKDLIARFSTDVIASCAFGLEANSLENPDAMFREMGRKIFEPTFSVLVRNCVGLFTPDLAKLFQIIITPKDVTKFFLGIVKETMEEREKNEVHRNDFLQLMIQLKNQGYVDDVNRSRDHSGQFTMDQAAAQAYLFFIGGFETSSTTLQFGLYELAKNQDIQDKMRREILESMEKNNGELTYDALFDLRYTGMVIDESLRKYPAIAFITRICTEEYRVPKSDLIIEKGTPIMIPTCGIHSNSKYYPNPDKFDPERFTEDEKINRHKFSYLPFGEGPRICIGQRFASMQMRIALVSMISKYRIELCADSPTKIKLDPKAIIPSPIGGMHLKVVRL